MVFETSAAVAISMEEIGFEVLEQTLERAESVVMSSVSYMEASIVLLSLRGPQAMRVFDEFLAENVIEIVAVDVQQARLAREAYARFGKGRGHPAQFEFGRLLLLCPRQAKERAVALRRKRLHSHRRVQSLTPRYSAA